MTDSIQDIIKRVLYHVGERDCYGHAANTPIEFIPVVMFEGDLVEYRVSSDFVRFVEGHIRPFFIIAVEHDPCWTASPPRYTFLGYPKLWDEAPFKSLQEAEWWKFRLETQDPYFFLKPIAYSLGKKRNLDAARRCALWPNATDEELLNPDLEEVLKRRLKSYDFYFQGGE